MRILTWFVLLPVSMVYLVDRYSFRMEGSSLMGVTPPFAMALARSEDTVAFCRMASRRSFVMLMVQQYEEIRRAKSMYMYRASVDS
jgi:hypothetical protein